MQILVSVPPRDKYLVDRLHSAATDRTMSHIVRLSLEAVLPVIESIGANKLEKLAHKANQTPGQFLASKLMEATNGKEEK